jgi:hypothetical protein
MHSGLRQYQGLVLCSFKSIFFVVEMLVHAHVVDEVRIRVAQLELQLSRIKTTNPCEMKSKNLKQTVSYILKLAASIFVMSIHHFTLRKWLT